MGRIPSATSVYMEIPNDSDGIKLKNMAVFGVDYVFEEFFNI